MALHHSLQRLNYRCGTLALPLASLCTALRLLLISTVLAACSRQHNDLPVQNAVYYWRTELRLDSTEQAFIKQHHVGKVYCRYFDVVMPTAAPSHSRSESDAPSPAEHEVRTPVPNATIALNDTLPRSTVLVPTIYITEDCMHQPHPALAEKLVKRVLQMNETNGISGVSELQIDCDYTDRSRKVYYDFLQEVRTQLARLSTQITAISATIRLHQLQMPPPPVDYGVLMLYNTGDPRKFHDRYSADGRLLEEGRNPLLDYRDVYPYLKWLHDYPLPLAAAYPVYQWVRHIHGVRVEHTVKASEIIRVKRAVEQQRPQLQRSIVTYHLDKENINRYKPEEYETFYSH